MRADFSKASRAIDGFYQGVLPPLCAARGWYGYGAAFAGVGQGNDTARIARDFAACMAGILGGADDMGRADGADIDAGVRRIALAVFRDGAAFCDNGISFKRG